MKSVFKISIQILLTTCLVLSCDNEKLDSNNPKDLLVGHWNSYEEGTEQTGFSQHISTSLTILYESGIAFSGDGTFSTRYHTNGTWTESGSIGTFEVKNNTISLTFFPSTNDEYKLDLELVKLDKTHLWFRHYRWGEQEHHLERTD